MLTVPDGGVAEGFRNTGRFTDGKSRKFAVKSYQCIEGTFGAQFLAAILCANYRFGPNGIDEGGVADDVVLGPPRSLDGFSLSNFAWDGKVLLVELAADAAGSELFRETGLGLRLVPKPGR